MSTVYNAGSIIWTCRTTEPGDQVWATVQNIGEFIAPLPVNCSRPRALVDMQSCTHTVSIINAILNDVPDIFRIQGVCVCVPYF